MAIVLWTNPSSGQHSSERLVQSGELKAYFIPSSPLSIHEPTSSMFEAQFTLHHCLNHIFHKSDAPFLTFLCLSFLGIRALFRVELYYETALGREREVFSINDNHSITEKGLQHWDKHSFGAEMTKTTGGDISICKNSQNSLIGWMLFVKNSQLY